MLNEVQGSWTPCAGQGAGAGDRADTPVLLQSHSHWLWGSAHSWLCSVIPAQIIRVMSQSWKVLLQIEPQLLQHSVVFVMPNSGRLAESHKRGLAPLAHELASSWSTASRDASIRASTDRSLTGKLIWKQEQNAAGGHCWRNSSVVHLQ